MLSRREFFRLAQLTGQFPLSNVANPTTPAKLTDEKLRRLVATFDQLGIPLGSQVDSRWQDRESGDADSDPGRSASTHPQ